MLTLSIRIVVTFNEEEKSIFLPSFLNGALPGSWPYPQTLDKAKKACQGQTLKLKTNICK
jgi:hypothetical protein